MKSTNAEVEEIAISTRMKKEDSPLVEGEKAGMMFDPYTQHLDLTKEEKRRTTALMLAIQAYDKIIIKDADYLKEMHNESRRENGPVIRPATMDAMVRAAIQFDMFIAGQLVVIQKPGVDEQPKEGTAPR